MKTIEQIKAILKNAPESATHIDSELDYWRALSEDECILMSTQYSTVIGQQYPLRSLADLREILALREENETLKIDVAVQLPSYKALREAFIDGVYWYEQSFKLSQIDLDKAAHDYAESILKRGGE